MNERLKHMPAGYRWVIEKGLVGFEAFTTLQPWYFLKEDELFDATANWPSGPSKTPLLAFARRQDCDDIACFETEAGESSAVVVIEGWTNQGKSYEIVARYPTFWDWMKSVIDDITEVSARPASP